jgi:pilus assembly protein CpaE
MIIVGPDPQERTVARLQLLSSRQVQVVAESSDFSRSAELIKQFRPHGALIIFNGNEDQPLDQVKRISREYPGTAVVCTGRDCPSRVIVQSYRAGAIEFLCQPLKPDEIQAMLAKIATRCGEDGSQIQTGRVIAVYSGRGGAGGTTLVVNLATAIARRLKGSTVVVVDLNLQHGMIPLFFGLDAAYSIADVVHNQDRLDAQLLMSFLLRVSENLYCLPAPLRVEEAEDVRPDHIRRTISMLRAQLTHVIIDCSHPLDNHTVAALDLADTIVLLSRLDVPSVYCAQRVLEAFYKLDFAPEKVKVVINRYDKRDGLSLTKVQEALATKVEMALTRDDHAVLSSINLGNPLVLAQPHSVLTKQYIELANRLSRRPDEAARDKKWGWNPFSAVLRGTNL